MLRNIFIFSAVGVGASCAVAFAAGATGGAIVTQGLQIYGNTISTVAGVGGDAISYAGHGVEGWIPDVFS